MLQSVLQAVFRLGRRDVDDEPDVHVHLHLHAGERLVLRLRQCGRDLARLQLLPPVRLRMLLPVRLRLVRLRRRYFQFEFQFRLRMQPLLRLSRYAAGRSTIRWGGPFSLLYKWNKSAIIVSMEYRHIAQQVQNRRHFHAGCSSV